MRALALAARRWVLTAACLLVDSTPEMHALDPLVVLDMLAHRPSSALTQEDPPRDSRFLAQCPLAHVPCHPVLRPGQYLVL